MAFGLTGASATFQGAINTTLQPLLCKRDLVFFDDILVYSDTWANHLLHLESVLQLLTKDNWHIKLSKCSFAKQEISYLGHITSRSDVATNPAKVETVATWPQPENCRELRGFLGLAGYYLKFVKNFGILAKPLTSLLKKTQFSSGLQSTVLFQCSQISTDISTCMGSSKFQLSLCH
jgi:hypothetical protein